MNNQETDINTISAKLQLQVDRLKKSKCCMRDEEMEISIRFANSEIGQEIEMLRKNIGKQWSIIDSFKVNGFISQVQEALESNRKNETINKMIRERNILTAEMEELQVMMANESQKLKEATQKLKVNKMERHVLGDLIKSTSDEANKNVARYLRCS